MNNKKIKRYKIIDEDGNVISTHDFEKNIEKDRLVINVISTEKQMKLKDNIIGFKRFNRENGGFVFVNVSENGLFKHDGLKSQDICRLVYLATFLDYSDRNGNYICKKSNNKIKKMIKREVMKLLNWDDIKKCRKFMKDMESLNILTITEEDYVMLNSEYFLKGSIKDMERYIRVYSECIHQLYEKNKTVKYNKIGYILQLIPYMDFDTNILKNPSTRENLTSMEVAKILGKSTDKGNVSKLINELTGFTVRMYEYEAHIFKYVTVREGDNTLKYFVFNPILCYGSNNFEELLDIMKRYFFNEKDLRQV